MLKSQGKIKAQEIYFEHCTLYGHENIPAKSAYISKIGRKLDQERIKEIEDLMDKCGVLSRKEVIFQNILEELKSNEQAFIKGILKKKGIKILSQREYKSVKLKTYLDLEFLKDCSNLPEKIKMRDAWEILSKNAYEFITKEVFEPSFYFGVKFREIVEKHDELMPSKMYQKFVEIISSKIIQEDNRYLANDNLSDDIKNFRKFGNSIFSPSFVKEFVDYTSIIEDLFYSNINTVFGMNVVFIENIRSSFDGEYGYKHYIRNKPNFYKKIEELKIKIWDRSPKLQASIENDPVFLHHLEVEELAFKKMVENDQMTVIEKSMISLRAKKRLRARFNKYNKNINTK